MDFITTATTTDEAHRQAQVALLPVGSFEQHGTHLPLITDTIVATAITAAIAHVHPVLQLPPVTISCSQEHVGWPGSVSIRSATLTAIVGDISESLRVSGISRLVIVNAHGGNYVLSNVVQEANINGPRMALFPGRHQWDAARTAAGIDTTSHDDMHAGELETSIILHLFPSLVGDGYKDADYLSERPDLLVLGMRAYTSSGVIGSPSLATAAKGKAVLNSLTASFSDTLELLEAGP